MTPFDMTAMRGLHALLGLGRQGVKQGLNSNFGFFGPQQSTQTNPGMNGMMTPGAQPGNWSLLANPAQGAALSAELPTPQQVMQMQGQPADASLTHAPTQLADHWPIIQRLLQQQGHGQPMSGFRGEHPMMGMGGK